MAVSEIEIRTQVEHLNENIDRFNRFLDTYAYTESIGTLHFLGTIDLVRAEQTVTAHWDRFLQSARHVLTDDTIEREAALGHIDAINLDYRRLITAIDNERTVL